MSLVISWVYPSSHLQCFLLFKRYKTRIIQQYLRHLFSMNDTLLIHGININHMISHKLSVAPMLDWTDRFKYSL